MMIHFGYDGFARTSIIIDLHKNTLGLSSFLSAQLFHSRFNTSPMRARSERPIVTIK